MAVARSTFQTARERDIRAAFPNQRPDDRFFGCVARIRAVWDSICATDDIHFRMRVIGVDLWRFWEDKEVEEERTCVCVSSGKGLPNEMEFTTAGVLRSAEFYCVKSDLVFGWVINCIIGMKFIWSNRSC